MTEIAISRRLFAENLRLIAELRPQYPARREWSVSHACQRKPRENAF